MKISESVISIRRLVTLAEALGYVSKIRQFMDTEKLVFDFSSLEYVKMLAVSLFAREVRQVVRYRKTHGLQTFSRGHDDNKSVPLSYLSFIGFFDFIGLHGIGKNVRHEAEVTCTNPYLAITSYDYRRFKSRAEYDSFRSEYDYIAEEAGTIAKLLDRSNDARNSLLAYTIRETMRNAYEHSGAVDFYVMGQSWSDGSAELIIMDDGNGILNSLKAKYPRLVTEKDAILESLKPGVSGSDFANNKYDNSGFGLYVMSEFAVRHGYICIVSGDCLIKKGRDVEECHMVWNDGTLVGIHLDSVPQNVHDEMTEIIRRGESISIQSEYPIRPSKRTWDF